MPRPHNRPPRRPGMTLLEVLLALAIFLLSLGAILSLIDFGAERGRAAAMQSTGTRLASSKLAEAEAGALDCKTATSGTFEEEPNWSYQLDSSSGEAAGLYLVTVTCKRTIGGREYKVTLAQYILDPAQIGTGQVASNPAPLPAASAKSGSTSSGGGSP